MYIIVFLLLCCFAMSPYEPPIVLPEVPIPINITVETHVAMEAIEEMYVSRIWFPVPRCIFNLPVDISRTSVEYPFAFDSIMSLLYMRLSDRGWDINSIDYSNFSIYLKTALWLNCANTIIDNHCASQSSAGEDAIAL